MTTREELHNVIDKLPDEQVQQLLAYVRSLMQTNTSKDDDPIIGMISGPTDVSVRAKDILEEDISQRGSWTQKRESNNE
jgi:hypothetical protein